MPFLSYDTIEEVNISGHTLDNSKLNKLGNLRLSPLKSLAVLFFALAFLLPKAYSLIPDMSLYLGSFSAAKELEQASDVPSDGKEAVPENIGQKEPEAPKQKKQTLTDIWPEEVGSAGNAQYVVQAVQAAPAGTKAVQPKKQTLMNIWPNETAKISGQPRRLVIPSIKVSANIESLGVKQGGEMEAPKNFREAGWFNLGPRPGEPGVAVIAGHLDSAYGAPGVFWHLSKLKAGDDIYITDGAEKKLHFRVSGSKIYSANSSSEEIFGKGGNARLNLITCNGVWDKKAQNYTNRLVVSADLVAE